MNTVKILLIGNDTINLQVVRRRLLEFDEEWLIINKTCEESFSELNNTKFSVVIIDCEKTTSDIITKIVAIKDTKQNWNTPVIVSFQESSPGKIKSTLEAGALDFIQKPYKNIELFARVRTALTVSSTIDKLDKQTRVINENQSKIQDVLSGLIPKEIIHEFTESGESKPKKYREASVLFVDLVDFTKKTTKLSPKIIIEELSEIFSAFDNITQKHDCTRIKTMGDGYLAVSGIPSPNKDHAANIINAANEMRDYLIQRNRIKPVQWEAKIGINSGEVIGSVLGSNNFLFDVFGDTVNVASRMEKNCEPNQINIAQNTYMLTRHKFRFIERLPNDVKGLGVKRMYYLKSSISQTGIDSNLNKPISNKLKLDFKSCINT